MVMISTQNEAFFDDGASSMEPPAKIEDLQIYDLDMFVTTGIRVHAAAVVDHPVVHVPTNAPGTWFILEVIMQSSTNGLQRYTDTNKNVTWERVMHSSIWDKWIVTSGIKIITSVAYNGLTNYDNNDITLIRNGNVCTLEGRFRKITDNQTITGDNTTARITLPAGFHCPTETAGCLESAAGIDRHSRLSITSQVYQRQTVTFNNGGYYAITGASWITEDEWPY
jgi:hypothetical protein